MKNILIILLAALFISCGADNENVKRQSVAVDLKAFQKTIAYSKGDPFIKSIKKSEFFKVSGLEDKIIETSNGTIISIPKAAFKDVHGKIVEQEVTVEIKDINSFEEQFNANINSPDGQNVLLNGGAIYINASRDDQQLRMNEDAPIYIETNQKDDPNLLIFEGIRNDLGEMRWINPKQVKKYLIPVNIDELDFLPEGFASEVEKYMPFANNTTSTKALIDSIYYSLNPIDIQDKYEVVLVEGYENINYYSSINDGDTVYVSELPDSIASAYCKAIKPSSIKLIKQEKFSKSFISTKQFEERIQTIHQTRAQKILEIYTQNLTKNLSYCDSLASSLYLPESTFGLAFNSYAQENWTNLENLPRSVERLGEYYTSNIKKVERELLDTKIKYENTLKKKSIAAQKLIDQYSKLLTKRQNYRLKKNGFILERLGWTGRGIIIEPMTVDLEVKNGAKYDRVHVYTIDPSISSIFSWRTKNKVNFNYAFAEDTWLVFKKGLQAKALVVAYRNEKPFFDIQDFRADNEVNIVFNLIPTSKNELNSLLNKLDRKSQIFNSLKVDLKYQASFFEEKQRLSKEISNRKVINRLSQFVYRCAFDSAE